MDGGDGMDAGDGGEGMDGGGSGAGKEESSRYGGGVLGPASGLFALGVPIGGVCSVAAGARPFSGRGSP